MNYENLTKRIEIAKNQLKKNIIEGTKGYDFWPGYLAALHDIRNDLNTGGKE